jgi:hypothetical protein
VSIDPGWIFGRFRMVLAGQPLGDWEDAVVLLAVRNWWAELIERDVSRWEPELDGLGARERFTLIYESVYGDHGPHDQGRYRFDIAHIGMSAFDPWYVFLVEPPDGGAQQVLWRALDPAAPVHEARLPAGALQAAGRAFVADIDRPPS